MNILILNWRDRDHPQAGGAEVHLYEIFGRLVKKGHQVILLTTRFKGGAEIDNHDGIQVLRWGRTFFFNWEAPLLIRRLLKRTPIDCIIDDVNKIPFFTPLWIKKKPSGVLFHHLFGKTIYELTAWPFGFYIEIMEALCGRVYRAVQCCTVSSSTAFELVAKGFDERNITIIENSVDTGRYTPEAQVVKEPDLLLYTGRLKRYKNLELLLAALRDLQTKGKKLRLAIAGAGDDEERLKKLSADLGIAASVSFLGFVDEQTKIDLYRRSIAFVNPSLKEGWGITSIEANACGTAVIANNVPGLRDSVRDGVSGILFKENDRADLVAAIIRITADAPFRTKLENGGLAWAQSFSWEQSAQRMEQWLKKVTTASGTRPA
ncbi:MAG: glycosyltransferase family 4 protein [Chitinivibrionales bacterium]|nr:glycosyltransferase family 4 protein [Chitinivibrionales bacterium]